MDGDVGRQGLEGFIGAPGSMGPKGEVGGPGTEGSMVCYSIIYFTLICKTCFTSYMPILFLLITSIFL